VRLSPADGPLGRAALIVAFVALLMLPQWLVGGLLIAATALAGARWASHALTRRQQGSAQPADGIPLGVDLAGEPVRLGSRELGAHGLILGASGAGKSTTLLRILSEHISRGHPVIALDLKGSPRFAEQLRAAAAAAGRRFAIWTPDGPGFWNPLAHGNPTELKDKLISTERFTEPHYQRAAERYVQTVLQVLEQAEPSRPPTFERVVMLMEPQRLSLMLRHLPPERAERLQQYLGSLTPDQLSAIRGLGTRLAIVSESHTGKYLIDGQPGTIDLREALGGEQVVLFSLNSSTYGKLSAQIGTLVIQDLVAAVGHRMKTSARPQAVVAVDEFSALGADNLISLLARGREAGASVLLSTQELADLDRAAPGLRDQVLGNTSLKLAHRQDVPGSAQTIAQMTGTEKVWEHTFSIGAGWLGRHDTSRGTRREVERYIVHPNEIKSLQTGQAVLISKGSTARPRTINVQPPRQAIERPRRSYDREAEL
jgi:conjugal transfer pilus assembly protein TraD